MSEIHEMRLAETRSSGAEEWYCPVCRRRILLQWPPRYELLVLERGDESVVHAGGKGGASIAGTELPVDPRLLADPAGPAGQAGPPGPEDRRWLREIGVAWDGDADSAA
ncbi:hypothetical protein [Streptomyces sp. NPDC026673]|uniref:hypothetical protein n=1 Tax=Streptomyces sp. NPDC026673 TaxID=3155724 RepID=UPI0033E9E615